MGPEPKPDPPRGVHLIHGTCRSVVLAGRWALKLPWGLGHNPIRGWLANRSEWRQRFRPGVCAPVATFGHLVLIMPRAERVATELDDLPVGGDGDETKPSSWGRFGDQWLLIDFDRCWELTNRGLVGWLYWANQERLGRKWAKL